MPAQLTTRQQVNGYRFLLRRLEHALMRRDVRMLHDPMRSHFRAVIVGVALAVLVTGGAFVYGLIKPAGSVGDSKIIVTKDSGGLYVMIDDTLHPVLNLASARLIIGSAEKPSSVSESKLSGYKRGPLVGIPGAPQTLPGPKDENHSYWTVCDTVLEPTGSGSVAGGVSTTVLAAAPENPGAARELSANEGLLVQSNDKTYLLNGGKRFLVDTKDPAVERAFDLDGATVRPVSAGMLNAFPEADELTTPDIEDRGKSSKTGLGAVGSVIEVAGVGDSGATLYVVLENGVQKVTQAAADVIRYSDDAGGGQVDTVAPAAITDAAQVHDLAVDDFPAVAPKIVEQRRDPVGCLAWDRGTGEGEAARLRILAGTGLPLDEGKAPVELATSDSSGSGLDGAYIPPSTGAYLATTGSDPESPRRESLMFVNDAGVRFEVADADTGKALGLGDKPHVAPWPIVGLLPAGPRLSQHDALVERDSVMMAGGTGSDVQVGEGATNTEG
ncbi:type VII secretion protein EccB [Gordonia sp. CPCC 206044]|uniref:type VII secretion protein EccB n=1 Tax=Gordonia sp. CPCC 206044 TaxID=3140793 RepID=UPI003AF3648C